MSLTCKFDIEKTFNTDDNTRRLVDVGGKKESPGVTKQPPKWTKSRRQEMTYKRRHPDVTLAVGTYTLRQSKLHKTDFTIRGLVKRAIV